MDERTAYALKKAFVLLERAVALRTSARFAAALACVDDALAMLPGFTAAHVERIGLLLSLQRHADALEAMAALLRIQPDDADMRARYEALCRSMIGACDEILMRDSQNPACLRQRADLQLRIGDATAALLDLATLCALNPADAEARNQLARAQCSVQQYIAALANYEQALSCWPDNAALHYNRGTTLAALGRLDEAGEACREALRLDPQLTLAQMEEACCLLAQGRFAEAWPAFEARWQTPQLREHYLHSAAPAWEGSRQGGHLLVWAEQGLGDIIQFARFLLRLPEEGLRVSLRVPATLAAMMQRAFPRITVIADSEALPSHDFHCPLMSLPYWLGLNDEAALGAPPYLRADVQQVARWQTRLGSSRRSRIGLVWCGRRYGHANPTRDIPLQALLPLFDLDADVIILQQPVPEAERSLLAAQSAFVCEEGFVDMDDTAALIACLDCVVAADTAVAHLAAALGKPCYLLLRASSEWRWQRERGDSYWYPGMRIFRQPDHGDWSGAVLKLLDFLAGPASPLCAARQVPTAG